MSDHISAADLSLDTRTDDGLFRWFLASMLFGRPVSQSVAVKAWERFIADGWTTPDHFIGRQETPLWSELYVSGYHRMGSVMHEELGAAMTELVEKYGGSVLTLVTTSADPADLEQRLQAVKGIGPKTTEIFLRAVPDDLIGSALPPQ